MIRLLPVNLWNHWNALLITGQKIIGDSPNDWRVYFLFLQPQQMWWSMRRRSVHCWTSCMVYRENSGSRWSRHGYFRKKWPNLIQLLLKAFSSTSSLEAYLEILSWTQIMASRLNQVLYGRSCAYKMQNTEMKLSRLAERSGEEFVFSLHLLKMFNGLTCLQYPIIAIVLLVDAP